MKMFLLTSIVLFSNSVFSKDVCVIEENETQFSIRCTVQEDSFGQYNAFDLDSKATKKAEYIKELLEKGYTPASKGLFVKN